MTRYKYKKCPQSTLVPPGRENVDDSKAKQEMTVMSFGILQAFFGGYFHLVDKAYP